MYMDYTYVYCLQQYTAKVFLLINGTSSPLDYVGITITRYFAICSYNASLLLPLSFPTLLPPLTSSFSSPSPLLPYSLSRTTLRVSH